MGRDRSDLCIHDLFEAQAQRCPQANALTFGPRRLSYAELNDRADRLAVELRARGVGPDVQVGVFADRSPEMLVGLLGILKAGGAFVPLDPSFPKDRLAYMLEDARPSVIVSQSWLLPELPVQGAEVISLDSEVGTACPTKSIALPSSVHAGNLAYVIYTSGSTGSPKGVQISHGAVVNLLHSMQETPGLTDRDRWLAITTLSFDIAIAELFLPLVVGARLLLASWHTTSDGVALIEKIQLSRPTVIQATPATWRLLLDAGWRGDSPLKILCGGEALTHSLACDLLKRCDSLWNMYGPTETTVWSTVHRVEKSKGVVPIGRPIGRTQVYVLDKKLQPVPAGEIGELHIGGAGLARGYCNRPDLTAEKFIPDPFATAPGSRLYRTGDLTRLLPDGALECLGRVDHQVKLRGFRVELGEIEAALCRHPALREAAAVAREQSPGDKQLVVYIVSKPGQTAPPDDELRRFLAQRLPAYMIPSGFVRLGALPRTPNGKVDRLALPAPETRAVDPRAMSRLSSEPAEAAMTRIWERVLGVSPIGIRDNIFDLGVNSLTAARLFAEIERSFGQRLPPAPLFSAPTIEKLVALLRQEKTPARWTSLVPIREGGDKPPLYCIHGGGGAVLMFHPLARHLESGRPMYGLQMQGLYGRAAIHGRIEEMAAHYVKEIRTLQPHGPYHLCGYCFGGIVAFEMAHQFRKQGEEVATLVTINGPSPDYIRAQSLLPEGYVPPAPYLGKSGRHRVIAQVRRGRILSAFGVFRKSLEVRLAAARLKMRKLRYRVCRRLGLRITERMRDWFFLLNNHDAELRYKPDAWPGRLDIIYSQAYYTDRLLGWGSLVTGIIEEFEVPSAHDNHRLIMIEPSVRIVAEKLKQCLQREEGRRADGSHIRRPTRQEDQQNQSADSSLSVPLAAS